MTNIYKIEELLPVVAMLSDRYTSRQSTSVTYEKAQQLMEAVLYCIHECEDDNQLTGVEKLSARDAYKVGYQKLLAKVKRAQDAYSEMIVNFTAFGNENYYETVTKGIAGFFQNYDDRFAPQDTILTMDYPTIRPIVTLTGIDAIEKYIEYITLEQQFMRALPQEYIVEILTRFQKSYRKQFYNICSIILRHILGNMLIQKSLNTVHSEKDYETLQKVIVTKGRENLKDTLTILLQRLIQEKYHNDVPMLSYLQGDIEDYTVELCMVQSQRQLPKVVVL